MARRRRFSGARRRAARPAEVPSFVHDVEPLLTPRFVTFERAAFAPSPNAWLLVRLVGTRTNRAAIGSRVIVEAEGRRQIQEVRSGGSFCSQSDLRLHFGLGRAREATRLTVKWLGGGQEILEHVPAGRLVVIQEGKGMVGQEAF